MIKKILIFVCPFITMLVLNSCSILDFSSIEFYHFNIITVNSIFAGFMFSALSMILGIGENKTIITLERINSMDKIYFSISSGIICNILSIIFSLLIIFIKNDLINIKLIKLLEVYFLITSILLFLFSVKYVFMIIKYTRKEIKNKYRSYRDIELNDSIS